MKRVRDFKPQAAPAQRAVRGADSPTAPAMLRRIASAAGNRSTGRLARARMLARDGNSDPKAAAKPSDYVFIMGKNLDGSKRTDAFYDAARKHFVDMNAVPGAT